MTLTVTLAGNDQNIVGHVDPGVTLIRQIQNGTETTRTGGHLNHPPGRDRGALLGGLRSRSHRSPTTGVESPEGALSQSTAPRGNARIPLRSRSSESWAVAIAAKPRWLLGAVPQGSCETLSLVGTIRDWRVKEENRT